MAGITRSMYSIIGSFGDNDKYAKIEITASGSAPLMLMGIDHLQNNGSSDMQLLGVFSDEACTNQIICNRTSQVSFMSDGIHSESRNMDIYNITKDKLDKKGKIVYYVSFKDTDVTPEKTKALGTCIVFNIPTGHIFRSLSFSEPIHNVNANFTGSNRTMAWWIINLERTMPEEEHDINNNLNENDIVTNFKLGSTGELQINLKIDVLDYIKNNEPLYITHPQLNLLFSYLDTTTSMISCDKFFVDFDTNGSSSNYSIMVKPKLLSNNLAQLTFEQHGSIGSHIVEEQTVSYELTAAKLFFVDFINPDPTDPRASNDDNAIAILTALMKKPYALFFFDIPEQTVTNPETEETSVVYIGDKQIIIKGFEHFGSLDFTIVQEGTYTSYFKINPTKKYLGFNYFFHVIQPKTWVRGTDFYMYYALFVTCYCDKNSLWYLYYNPGGYLKDTKLYVGLSIMGLDGEHVNLGCVALIRTVDDSTIIHKESKSFETYTEYGDVDTFVTTYDNFTDSSLSTLLDADNESLELKNIAQDVLEYNKTHLYLDNDIGVGMCISKTGNDDIPLDVYDIVDGDLSYSNPIRYIKESNSYNTIVYSKQFSQIFDKKITKNDIKEISIIGPIEYNIFEQTNENRPFDYVLTRQQENTKKDIGTDGVQCTVTVGTTHDSIYYKPSGHYFKINDQNKIEVDNSFRDDPPIIKIKGICIQNGGSNPIQKPHKYVLLVFTCSKYYTFVGLTYGSYKPNRMKTTSVIGSDRQDGTTYGDSVYSALSGNGYTMSDDKHLINIVFESYNAPVQNANVLDYASYLFITMNTVHDEKLCGYDISEVEYYKG